MHVDHKPQTVDKIIRGTLPVESPKLRTNRSNMVSAEFKAEEMVSSYKKGLHKPKKESLDFIASKKTILNLCYSPEEKAKEVIYQYPNTATPISKKINLNH
jgi:hypothetical protein